MLDAKQLAAELNIDDVDNDIANLQALLNDAQTEVEYCIDTSTSTIEQREADPLYQRAVKIAATELYFDRMLENGHSKGWLNYVLRLQAKYGGDSSEQQ